MPCKSGRRRNAQVPTTGLACADLSGRRTDSWRLGRRLDAEPAWQRAWIRPGSRGVVVPVCMALAACVLARIRAIEASLWAFASVALTGALVLFLMYFVEHVVRPA